MFYGILIFIHVIICVCLIAIVLIQAGRGGGLAENFSGAESIFGTKTNSLLTRATTVFAVMFFITCLSLAFISRQRSMSLINSKNIPAPAVNTTMQQAPEKTPPVPSQGQDDKAAADIVPQEAAVAGPGQAVKQEKQAEEKK